MWRICYPTIDINLTSPNLKGEGIQYHSFQLQLDIFHLIDLGPAHIEKTKEEDGDWQDQFRVHNN